MIPKLSSDLFRRGLPQNCHSDDLRDEESAAHHVDRPLAALGVTGGRRIWDIVTGHCYYFSGKTPWMGEEGVAPQANEFFWMHYEHQQMQRGKPMAVDPISLEVFKNMFESVAEEMGVAP